MPLYEVRCFNLNLVVLLDIHLGGDEDNVGDKRLKVVRVGDGYDSFKVQ